MHRTALPASAVCGCLPAVTCIHAPRCAQLVGNTADPCSKLRVPPLVATAMESYAARYHHLKKPRK